MSPPVDDISCMTADQKRSLLKQLLAARPQSFPQSFSQRRIWFLEQMQPGSSLFNVPAAVRVRGRRWQLAEAERAINEVARRHQILRTTFDHVGGHPVQLVGPRRPICIQVVDLTHLPPQEREAELRRIIRRDARQPFNLVEGPLFRIQLLITGPLEQVIYFNMHHLIADGVSIGVLLREMAILYLAYCSGQPAPLPDLPAQFTDFVRWQQEAAGGELFRKQLSYWKRRLHGTPPSLNLPTDRPRPPVVRFCGARERFTISPQLTTALRRLGQQHGVTQFMVLMAAFQSLLYRYSGQQQLRVGSPVTGRNRTEFEALIGCFANLVVFLADFRDQPSFRELLVRTRQATLDAFANQDLPFEQLVDALDDRRDLSRAPLFQVMFAFSSLVGKQEKGFEKVLPGLEMVGLDLEQLEIDTGTSMFDLTLWVDELPDQWQGMVEYNTDLFDAATIRQLIAHYEQLLQRVALEPDEAVSKLSLLGKEERQKLLVNWNETDAPLPSVECAHQLFERQARQAPQHPAMVCACEHRTYGELDQQSNRLATHLQRLGVSPDALVAVCLPRSPALVVAMLGVLKAGGAFLPLDPTLPRARLEFMLRDSGAAVLVTGGTDKDAELEFSGKRVDLTSDEHVIASQTSEHPPCLARSDDLAYAIYTSGSTGTPKAVAIEHGGLVNLIEAQRQAFGVDSHSRVLQFASPSFDAAISEIFVTLGAGATLILAPQEKLLDPDRLLGVLRTQRVTTVTLPPSLLSLLPAADLPDLDTLVSAGEPCRQETVDRWAPGRRFINAYGPAETTVCATLGVCREGEDLPAIGRPIANTRVYVLDRYRQPVPLGVPGELYIGGSGVARGYLHRPELDRQRFVSCSFPEMKTPTRLYRTGDLVRWRPDGSLQFLGRVDQQVKIRGMRAELGEIEATLASHPGIREAAVVADQRSGGNVDLVAFCVAEAGAELSVDEVRRFLAQQLPAYMVPSAFEFPDQLCRLPSGKIDRQQLLAGKRTPRRESAAYFAPRDELESSLVKIWEEVLERENIGIRDNFFSLGGHSLKAVVLKYRMQEEFGEDISLASFLHAPTIEQLAVELRRKAGVQAGSPWVALRSEGTKAPLVLVHPTVGNVFCYVELSRHLDQQRPLFALQSCGLAAPQLPHTSIAEMATSYVAALGKQLPSGPFVLGGWSMGGAVALEMAQQLQSQGREVPLLLVIDTPLLDSQQIAASLQVSALDAFFMAELNRQLGDEIDVSTILRQLHADEPVSSAQVLPSTEKLQQLLQQVPLPGISTADFGWDEINQHLEVAKCNLKAHEQYRPRKYRGNVVLFCPEEPFDDSLPDSGERWRMLVNDQVEVRRVPGNHFTMLKSPHVEVLGRGVTEVINEHTRGIA